MSDKPNIIYIHTHDIGKHLGCYNHQIKSPNINQFAKDSILFNRAFTNAVACSPSRGCVMTGKYSHTNGMIGLSHVGWPLAEEQRTIVDIFNENGYNTIHFGHQHERLSAKENRYNEELFTDHKENFSEHCFPKAIDYLKERKTDSSPFYLNIGTADCHASKWSRASDDKPDSRIDLYGGPVLDSEVYMPEYLDKDVPRLREEMARFQSSIAYFDDQFGIFINQLKELGYFENSIIVFTTDHGISNMRAKGWLYDAGTEISLMMHVPEKFRGNTYPKEINQLIQNIDYAPTFLEASGIEIPGDMQGKSFWPLLRNESYVKHSEIFMERNNHVTYVDVGNEMDPIRAARSDKYLYIKNFDLTCKKPWFAGDRDDFDNDAKEFMDIWPKLDENREEEELYDCEQDPLQCNNLAYNPEFKEIKDSLASKLENWQKETADDILTAQTS